MNTIRGGGVREASRGVAPLLYTCPLVHASQRSRPIGIREQLLTQLKSIRLITSETEKARQGRGRPYVFLNL